MDRRTLLQSLAAGLAVTVAGCGGSETPTQTETAPPATATETPAPTATPAKNTASPTQTPTETPTQEPTPTQTPEPTATPEPTPTPVPVAQVVEVGADGFSFTPETFTISVGDTVEWTWAGDSHNVTADSTPDGADWLGSPGAPDATYDSGYTYRETFDVPGEYTYYCRPHRSLEMRGSFTVVE